MRFTTAEEARDPYANAVRRFVKGTAVDTEKVGKITRAQLEKIAEIKKDQLNAVDLEGAIKVVAGTARSMGVEIAE